MSDSERFDDMTARKGEVLWRRWRFVAVVTCLVLAAAVLVIMCTRSVTWITKVETFPQGVPYPSDSWQYVVEVRTETAQQLYQRSKKRVSLEVRDRSGVRVLRDKLEYDCAGVETTVTWNTLDVLEIELWEVGVEYEGADAKYNQPYSVELARSGPRILAKLVYRFDPETERFERTE